MTKLDNNIKIPATVGIINPPNKSFDRGLYSDAEARAKFQAIEQDLYQAGDKHSYESKTKTPVGILASVGIVAAALIFVKTGLLKKLKGLISRVKP